MRNIAIKGECEMLTAKAHRKSAALTVSDREVLATLVSQINGILICTLAACEGRPHIPQALQSSIEGAVRIAQEAQQML